MNLLLKCLLLIYSILQVSVSANEIKSLPTTDESNVRIYLVRQGQSTATAYFQENGEKMRYVSGQSPQISLTDYGKEQMLVLAKDLAQKFPQKTKLVITSSSLIRTQQTAQIMYSELYKTHPHTILTKKTYSGLNERSLGAWEGCLKNEVYKKATTNWLKKSAAEKFVFPEVEGGESYSQVAERALKDLEEIYNSYPDSTVILATSTVTMNALNIKVNQLYLSKKTGSNIPKLQLKNGDLILLEIPKKQKFENLKIKII